MRWRHQRSSADEVIRQQALDTVEECEAFLAGRYHERFDRTDRLVPAWAWLNVLAHASAAELRDVSSGERWHRGGECRHDAWRAALAFLASELIDITGGDDARLRAIQQSQLVPLELRLAVEQPTGVVGPAQLASTVVATVRRHPSTGFDARSNWNL